ncbi:MAG: hypothetical protein ABS81_03175 [Pseudonocardia sp. SCN 72-86]|nr:MAG: hypothetical protein ABS81_03175 [Pseudonocardia sp. SCN 72-86]
MPRVRGWLESLVSSPSVSLPGHPTGPVHATADLVSAQFREAGADLVEIIDIPGGHPLVRARLHGPPDAPTVVLYAHYDVQPATERQSWATDPWTLREGDDGRWYGRGVADDKSGVAMHLAAVALLRDAPPVSLEIIIEGEEETCSHLGSVIDRTRAAEADAIVVADLGPPRVGIPALTTSLRGVAACTVEVRTLEHDVHSGQLGGVAPDALQALIMTLSSLYGPDGAVDIPGLTTDITTTPDRGTDLGGGAAWARRAAAVLPGAGLLAEADFLDRLSSGPAITVIGLDVPRPAEASNVVLARAGAKLSLRTAPRADAGAELAVLAEFLRSRCPSWATVTVDAVRAAPGWTARRGGRLRDLARVALEETYGSSVLELGSGVSIPAVRLLERTAPRAELILWGPQDTERANIHGADESLNPDELARMITAQVAFLASITRHEAGIRATRKEA